ncbi:hypothetical protein INR49_009571 [Caranx melampygus]|nr:hypothetical protein INR49_009571 [Caranx melampygus]
MPEGASASTAENAALREQRHGNLPAHLLQHQHVPGNEHGHSIANLRLKAKEYSLNQVPTVN